MFGGQPHGALHRGSVVRRIMKRLKCITVKMDEASKEGCYSYLRSGNINNKGYDSFQVEVM